MIEVDRAVTEDYRIGFIQMVENAGRRVAQLARERFFAGERRAETGVVLIGGSGGLLVCYQSIQIHSV